MKLNKNIENGLLLTIYLARRGQSNVKTASSDLQISIHFLEQIARKLRIVGVLSSVKGPGGGYRLNPTSTALDVITALGYKSKPMTDLLTIDGDILNNMLDTISEHQNAVLSQTIVDLAGTSVNLSQTSELDLYATANT